jgi:guanosine-3',5'-bis(diphosphate) 3'-pyrophosphohydrolase
LPVGVHPVDFAYAVHTEVGHTCIGARSTAASCRWTTLKTAATLVEIFTSKVDTAGPSRDWLHFVEVGTCPQQDQAVVHPRAPRGHGRAGRDELLKEFRRESLPVQRMWASDAVRRRSKRRHTPTSTRCLAAIGEGHVSARSVAQKVARTFRSGRDAEQPPATVMLPTAPARVAAQRCGGARRGPRRRAGAPVALLHTRAGRRDRRASSPAAAGVSVHRTDCANAVSLMTEQAARLIDVEWDGDQSGRVPRRRRGGGLDRSKLLRDVANSLSEQHVNIVACSTHTGSDRVAKMRFEFELADPSHLDAVLRTIKQIDGVYEAYRQVPGKGG